MWHSKRNLLSLWISESICKDNPAKLHWYTVLGFFPNHIDSHKESIFFWLGVTLWGSLSARNLLIYSNNRRVHWISDQKFLDKFSTIRRDIQYIVGGHRFCFYIRNKYPREWIPDLKQIWSSRITSEAQLVSQDTLLGLFGVWSFSKASKQDNGTIQLSLTLWLTFFSSLVVTIFLFYLEPFVSISKAFSNYLNLTQLLYLTVFPGISLLTERLGHWIISQA